MLRGLIGLVLLATLGSWSSLAREASAAKTELVSVDAQGQPVEGQFPSMSADGRFVAFASGARVFVRDRLTRTTITVTEGAATGLPRVFDVAISGDGRSVVFSTRRFEPEPSTPSPGRRCPEGVFPQVHDEVTVHDLETGAATSLFELCFSSISRLPLPALPVSASGDGRFVLISSRSTLDFRVVDRQTGEQLTTRLVDAISADGRFVAGRLTSSEGFGYLVQDPRSAAIVGISPVSRRQGGRAGLSEDGRFVVFSLGFPAPSPPSEPRLDVFVHDRQRGGTELVSLAADGGEPDGDSCLPSISANGQFVAFVSAATNLVAGDDNALEDVFVHDRLTGVTHRVNADDDGRVLGIPPSTHPGRTCTTSRPVISGDGRFVAFESDLSVYVRDRGTTVTSFVTDLYQHVLGRAPDRDGREGWEAFLGGHCDEGGVGATVAGFVGSSEFLARAVTPTGIVEAAYRALLGRGPDADGLAAYVATLTQQRVELADRLLGSPEFLARLPNRQDPAAVTAAITRLYAEMLDRPPDESGLAAWVGYVTATGDIDGAVEGFIRSSEFESRPLTLSGYVRILYRALLGRDPDPAEASAAEDMLRAHLVSTAQAFILSPEFQARRRDICGV